MDEEKSFEMQTSGFYIAVIDTNSQYLCFFLYMTKPVKSLVKEGRGSQDTILGEGANST